MINLKIKQNLFYEVIAEYAKKNNCISEIQNILNSH